MNKINPTKDETPSGLGKGLQVSTNSVEFTPEKKRLATLRARAAMAGVQLHVYDDEDTGQTVYLVSRWALTRQLESLDAAEAWLTQVTGVKHG